MATRLQRLRRSGLAETLAFAGPGFRRAAPWLLAAILIAGLATRLHPAVRYAVWGSDSGEYLYLTERLVATGRISFEYDGWGLAYPYFPGMFVLSGALHAITGVDLFYATQWTVPAVAALTGVLVGLIAHRVSGDPRAGILGGAFVAVTAPVVLVTSHAMPGSLGHVFLLALLALLPDAYRDRRNVALLALFGLALLVTHHLSTYFAIGILAFVPFYREMTQRQYDGHKLRVEIPLVGGLLALSLLWWLGVSAPFREEIVGDALPFPPLVTAVLFLVALAALPALVVLRRIRSPWHMDPRYPTFQRQRALVVGGLVGFLGLLVVLVAVKLPGTNIDLGWSTLVYAVPLVLWLAFLPVGLAIVRFHRHSSLLVAWLYAILGSLAFAIATESHVLFPFRHVDYMVEAMAPFVAMGILLAYDQTLAARIPAERPRARTNLSVAILALLLASAVFSLPPRETLGGFEEGITREELAAVRWAEGALPDGTTIAADHRLSSLLFGIAGLHPTWDYTPRTYHAEDPREALEELRAARVPPRDGDACVEYVVLSPPIEAGVTLVQWETSAPMSAPAIAKFDDERFFERVYPPPGALGDVRIWRVLYPAEETFMSARCVTAVAP